MDKLLKSLNKYLKKYIPSYPDTIMISAEEDNDNSVVLVFRLGKKELGRTTPRVKHEVEEFLTIILYEAGKDSTIIDDLTMAGFMTGLTLTATAHYIEARGFFNGNKYIPAMMLDEMFMGIHEALNG